MMSKQRTEIVNNLQMQVRLIEKHNDNMTDASWGYEHGVIISGNDAKELIEMFVEFNKYRRRVYGNKPRNL